MTDLCALAQRYVELATKIENVRREMPSCLANGAGSAPAAHPTPRGARRVLPAQAKDADETVLALLKAKSMKQSEIAQATEAAATTLQKRLARLRDRGLVERGGDGAWNAVNMTLP
jgi:uncharacterized membrane protein